YYIIYCLLHTITLFMSCSPRILILILAWIVRFAKITFFLSTLLPSSLNTFYVNGQGFWKDNITILASHQQEYKLQKATYLNLLHQAYHTSITDLSPN